MKKIIVFGIFLLSLMALSSCAKDHPFKSTTSGDFLYSKVGVPGENNVAIIGLSEEGKTKETLVFPTMLDGYHVFRLGTHRIKKSSGIITFNKAKNIYFHGQYNNLKTTIKYEYDENIEYLNIFIGERYLDKSLFTYAANVKNSKVFVKKEYLDKEVELGYDKNYNYVPANVAYYLDEEELFFLDDADGSKVNVIPPAPYKEGYQFLGWYKDFNGSVKWDFEHDIVPKKVYDEEGNYEFHETKIYAKWQKIT